MGANNFFSKFASIDPLAHALHLPGANKYSEEQARRDAGTSGAGPYAGVAPTLAGANAGYAPGGPGAVAGWHQWQPNAPGGAFGFAQRFSNAVGNTTPNPAGGQWTPSNPGQLQNTMNNPAGGTYAAPPGINPYVAAIPRMVGTQGQPNPMQSR